MRISDDLKRIIIISVVNAVALYYTNKLLEKSNIVPSKPNTESNE